jgi:hypothetical protein
MPAYPEIFHGFPQSLQANVWIVLQVGHDATIRTIPLIGTAVEKIPQINQELITHV